jgi:hypothetical protein
VGKLFGGNKSAAATPGDAGRATVAKSPDNVLGGYTDKTKPEGTKLSSGGFVDDGARRMPGMNDALARENERRIRGQLSGRSGRAATNLSGTRAYLNNFLGGTL